MPNWDDIARQVEELERRVNRLEMWRDYAQRTNGTGPLNLVTTLIFAVLLGLVIFAVLFLIVRPGI